MGNKGEEKFTASRGVCGVEPRDPAGLPRKKINQSGNGPPLWGFSGTCVDKVCSSEDHTSVSSVDDGLQQEPVWMWCGD